MGCFKWDIKEFNIYFFFFVKQKVTRSLTVFFCTIKLCGSIFVLFDRKNRNSLNFQRYISLKLGSRVVSNIDNT